MQDLSLSLEMTNPRCCDRGTAKRLVNGQREEIVPASALRKGDTLP
jgi:hypothetical protein